MGLLSKEFEEAGARQRTARAPAWVDAAWFAAQCDQLERILRLQLEDGELPPRDEAELARHDPSDITGAIRRFAFLKHLYYRRSEDLVHRSAGSPDIQEAARQLLVAEPLRLQLAGTTVEVTDRSYSAMYAIASHWMAVQMLSLDIERAERLYRALQDRRRSLYPWERGGRRRIQRHLRRVGAIFRRCVAEREGHRQAIYAHAFTPHGGPAAGAEEAPDWWRRIDPREDAVLVAAFLDVGGGRYARLGPPPERDDDRKEEGEDFGWASLFASIEKEQRVPPATAFDRRFFQQLTWLRASAPPIPEEVGG